MKFYILNTETHSPLAPLGSWNPGSRAYLLQAEDWKTLLWAILLAQEERFKHSDTGDSLKKQHSQITLREVRNQQVPLTR